MSKDQSSSHHPDSESRGKDQEDDVIVVPRGTSRSRFIMTALLAVLVLTTFTVSGEVLDVLKGRSLDSGAYMSWRGPDGVAHELGREDFLSKKRSMSKATGLLSSGQASRDHDDPATAKHILADEMAKHAGVAVTDAELSRLVLQVFGTADTYRRRLADFRTTPKEFEETLRSILRVRRYEMLLSGGYALPSPDDVARKWKETHQEYALEAIELPTERFASEAAAACPAGDELKAWFEALPEAEKSTYGRPIEAKVSAEFVWFSIDPFTRSERLLAKYPRPESEDAVEVARTWYESHKDTLYLKSDRVPGKPLEPSDYKPFEEVQDHAQTAGLAYQSTLDWFNDMKIRESGGESIVLQLEGTNLGFGYRQEPAAKTMAEWEAAGMLFRSKAPILELFEPDSEPQKLLPEVFQDTKGFFIGRVLSKEPGRTPEFAEFEDKVRENWIQKKQVELARAKLEALVSRFTPQPDPYLPGIQVHVEPDGEKFLAAAGELGLEVKTEEWFDASSLPAAGESSPYRQFLRRSASRFGATLGTITNPESSPDSKVLWIARIAGRRDPDIERMTPMELASAEQLASFEARNDFIRGTFLSDEYLREHFALDLEVWRREAESSTPSN